MGKLEQAESNNTLPSKADLQKGFENLSQNSVTQMNTAIGNLNITQEARKPSGTLNVATGKIGKDTPESRDFHTPTIMLGVRG